MLDKFILQHINKSRQFILTDDKGVILESNDTFLPLEKYAGKAIEALIPFLAGYIDHIVHSENENRVELNSIEFDIMGLKGKYDLRLIKVEQQKKKYVMISLEDRTAFYKRQQSAHQLRVNKILDNDLIREQSEIINKQNEDIKMLVKETHHRIKNNLQVIVSLLNFQSKEVEDPKVEEMFNDVKNRVHSMALLHEKLYRTSNLKNVNVKEYLNMLVGELVDNNSLWKNITYDIDIKKIDLNAKTLVPLGLMINELITNSLKHGFKDKNEGHIVIRLEPTKKPNEFRLLVTDDGVGIPKDIFQKESQSLGTELIQMFAEQLSGEIKILDGPGTQIELIMHGID